jgi:uncharacterized Ntn-hydrolase superfamily protein
MSDNVQSAVLDVLKRIQNENADFRRSVEDRLDRIEDILRKQRRNVAGMQVMMTATAGDFDQRVSDIESRMDAIEASRS